MKGGFTQLRGVEENGGVTTKLCVMKNFAGWLKDSNESFIFSHPEHGVYWNNKEEVNSK